MRAGLFSLGLPVLLLWALFGAYAALVGSPVLGAAVAIVCAVIAAAHELGHYLALRWSGLPIVPTDFATPIGAALAVDDSVWGASPRRAVVVCLAGPVAGLLATGLMWALVLVTGGAAHVVVLVLAVGLGIGDLSQLLPVRIGNARFDGAVALGYLRSRPSS